MAETSGDGWAAERLLSDRLAFAGVLMSTGEAYHAPEPGRFRLVFSVKQDILEEGIRAVSEALCFPPLLLHGNL